MLVHVVIHDMVTYKDQPEGTPPPYYRVIYMTVNDLPVPVTIPPEIPSTRPDIKAYLLSQVPAIEAAYKQQVAAQPIHNVDINMEFDIDWPL